MNTKNYDAYYLDAVNKGYWKDLNERYSVSKYGTVYDKERDRIVKPCLNNKGYELIKAKYNEKWRAKFVHQLVWEAFNGKIPEGMEINHIDENKQNNCLENLNLMTHKENMNWGTCIERVAKANSKVQRNHPNKSKPIIQKSLQGEIIKIWPSLHEIQRELGYSQGNICSCCNGKRKTAYKYIWEYKKATA